MKGIEVVPVFSEMLDLLHLFPLCQITDAYQDQINITAKKLLSLVF